MHFSPTLLLAAATAVSAATSAATFRRSSKRGLVFVPSTKHVSDNQIWVENNSDLSWYYNYQVQPSAAYANRSQAAFEFVPMLWTTSTTFLTSIKGLINGGRNITHILTYNEPDGTAATGGSNINPSVAAANWIEQVEPLRSLGVKVSAPAVTGSPGGFTWLKAFFDACAGLGTNCTADFIPVHWYGNFEGLASHLGEVVATYPNKPIWITEYALNNSPLSQTQYFFNTSAEYFDRLNYTDRYSYFGSFRSDVSNIGPNAAMLTPNGSLTDIGSWYLGGPATGNIPAASSSIKEMANVGLLAIFAACAGVLVL